MGALTHQTSIKMFATSLGGLLLLLLFFMSVLFWNCRGAGSKEFLRHARELVSIHKVDMLIIVEPRISGNNADKVIRKLLSRITRSLKALPCSRLERLC